MQIFLEKKFGDNFSTAQDLGSRYLSSSHVIHQIQV